MDRTKSKTILISNKKKFIFIHNYKVAGTSIRTSLAKYVSFDDWLISNLFFFLGIRDQIGKYNSLSKHQSAREVKKSMGKGFDEYFSFGMVRNPWDWEVSKYYYMLKNKYHFQHELTKSFGSFDRYIEWREMNYKTQLSFFEDETNKILVNHIGKIEELEKFYLVLENYLEEKIERSFANASRSSKEYKNYYNTKTKSIVGEIYAYDIDHFSYQF